MKIVYEFETGDKVSFEHEGSKVDALVVRKVKNGLLRVVSTDLEVYDIANNRLKPLNTKEDIPAARESNESAHDIGYYKTQQARENISAIYHGYCVENKSAKQLAKEYNVSIPTIRSLARRYAVANGFAQMYRDATRNHHSKTAAAA